MFVQAKEIEQIILDLMENRQDLFGELFKFVYPEMIVCGLRVDKSPPKSQKWTLKIEGIRGTKTLLTDKKYIIHGYDAKWNECSYEKKVAHVARCLRSIDFPTEDEVNELASKGKEYEIGKIVKPDVEDFKSFLTTLGVDWSDNKSSIPNIMEDKKIFV